MNTSARSQFRQPLPVEQAAIDAPTPEVVLRDEDRRIMALAASMDPAAQRTVAQRLFGRVQRMTRMLLADAVEAEDATQLALLEILRSAGGYRGESSIEQWADKITARTALRLARKRRERESHFDRDADLEILPVEEEASGVEGEVVERMLERLSPPLREALVLRHVMGHSVPESAELLGVSPNTVKDRLVRARDQLRRMVRRKEQSDTGGKES